MSACVQPDNGKRPVTCDECGNQAQTLYTCYNIDTRSYVWCCGACITALWPQVHRQTMPDDE